jgi:hypothetical protein
MRSDDIWMINLHRREDGRWSYAAYTTGLVFWRSNKGLSSVEDCLLEIGEEMEAEKAVSGVRAPDSESVEGLLRKVVGVASGGMGSKVPVERKATAWGPGVLRPVGDGDYWEWRALKGQGDYPIFMGPLRQVMKDVAKVLRSRRKS